ncbi:ribosome biogenesis GTPase YlqF [Candidatus Enterovibrio altilux]|nr:ribosome biogenesis GTPase YlqF [Candidatus Enterovibrio luxaltus]
MTNNSIQWFPGHMHKARKKIEEVIPKVDIIIEVLDARIPFSSQNPLIHHICKNKLVIKILNKRDLADPEMTAFWLSHLEKKQGVKAMAITTRQISEVNRIIALCRKFTPHYEEIGKQIFTMIMGIPNVGKSTIINILAGSVVAQTGNQPAVTRQQQRINLQNSLVLLDTPGILWSKVENPYSSFRLAATGAIKDTAMKYDEVAFYIVKYLVKAYPEFLKKRYNIEVLPETDIELMTTIGEKRGCLRSGGRIDLHKASEILINDLRNGMLGRITFEHPKMIDDELIHAEEAARKKTEEKAKVKEERRKRYLRNKR